MSSYAMPSTRSTRSTCVTKTLVAAVLQRELSLACQIPMIERHRDATEQPTSEVEVDELGTVRQEHGDAVTRYGPCSRQPAGDASGPLGELGVRAREVADAQRNRVGRTRRGRREQLGQVQHAWHASRHTVEKRTQHCEVRVLIATPEIVAGLGQHRELDRRAAPLPIARRPRRSRGRPLRPPRITSTGNSNSCTRSHSGTSRLSRATPWTACAGMRSLIGTPRRTTPSWRSPNSGGRPTCRAQ